LLYANQGTHEEFENIFITGLWSNLCDMKLILKGLICNGALKYQTCENFQEKLFPSLPNEKFTKKEKLNNEINLISCSYDNLSFKSSIFLRASKHLFLSSFSRDVNKTTIYQKVFRPKEQVFRDIFLTKVFRDLLSMSSNNILYIFFMASIPHYIHDNV